MKPSRMNQEKRRAWEALMQHVETDPELALEMSDALESLNRAAQSAMNRMYKAAVLSDPPARVRRNVVFTIRDAVTEAVSDAFQDRATEICDEEEVE